MGRKMRCSYKHPADEPQNSQKLDAADGFGCENQTLFVKMKQPRELPIPNASDNQKRKDKQRVPEIGFWKRGSREKKQKRN
jgi:hypothetical protein